MKPLDPLAFNQINRRLKKLRDASPDTQIRSGWVRYMRQALGMTLSKLAKHAHLSIGTIAQIERGEAAGKITLKSLKKIAEAMECEFVYAFVPQDDLELILKKAALKKAKLLLATADTHMSLEDQQVKQSMESRIERLANRLIEKGDVW